jgi:histidinol-phosphatase
MGRLYRALRGDGAFRDDRPIRVSDVADLGAPTIFYTGTSWLEEAGKLDAFFELTRRTQVQRGYGDFYGFMLVAQGSGEMMVDYGVHAWDVAAVIPIVMEAGGRFSNFDGATSIDRKDALVSNGKVHEEGLRILSGEPRA